MRYLFILFFVTSKVIACDCSTDKSVLEFYNAEYVFEGVVSTKHYNDDYTTYSVAFKVDKHYKDGNKPKVLRFKFQAEKEHTDESNSCDWSVEIGQRWLVYAHRNNKGELSFNYYCSNSKILNYSTVNTDEQKVLDNANDFIIDDFLYENNSSISFNLTKPISNIDSIIKSAKMKSYNNTYAVIKLYVSKKGILKAATSARDYSTLKIDKTFDIPYQFKISKDFLLNDFEKEALRLASRIKKWEVKYHKKTKIPVEYIQNIIFQYDNDTKKLSYEL